MFALVDCNNFYASCERVFRPELNGRPVVVLSNNDGCVIARSNEAKVLGIPMGAPFFEYGKTFSDHGVEVFSANFPLYGDMSSRVMSILAEYAPEMEVYSIDEAFLMFTGLPVDGLHGIGKAMRERVLRWTGIPISIGFARTRSLAKVANRVAKKFSDRTGGVYVLEGDEKVTKALRWLPVGDVWGIGRQHAKRLTAAGARTALDFTLLDGQWVKGQMGVTGARLQRDLQGFPTLGPEMSRPRKSIATTRSFERNLTEFGDISERISTFAVSCAEKLRRQQTCCNTLTVFLLPNRHRPDLPQYGRSITVGLPFATSSCIELAGFARSGLNAVFREGFHYKKAGVIVGDIVPESCLQTSLFGDRDGRHIPLMEAIDRVNATHGRQKVRLASQDVGKVWKMRQEKLSQRYTTDLSEVITVHCR